jgi:hypothetical protein
LRFSQEAIRKLGLNLLHKTTLMKHFILTLGLLSTALAAQTDSLQVVTYQHINRNGKFYATAELALTAPKNFGLGAEYYFSPNISLIAKLKTFDIAFNYHHSGFVGGGGFGAFESSPASDNFFRSRNLAIPIGVKWQFKLYHDLTGFLELAAMPYVELSNDQQIIYKNITIKHKPKGIGYHFGYGLDYAFNPQNSIYLNAETFMSGSAYDVNNLGVGDKSILAGGQLSLGYRYGF